VNHGAIEAMRVSHDEMQPSIMITLLTTNYTNRGQRRLPPLLSCENLEIWALAMNSMVQARYQPAAPLPSSRRS
jgi:hypothetical protein